METKDKRVKREIANSNERRRMQSINAGFQRLKRLLPVNDSEKLSKASILQNAAEFIQQIEREKLALYEQNTLLRGILMEIKNGADVNRVLETIDLDALPTIPLHTTIDFQNSNSNDDRISRNSSPKEIHKSTHKNGNNRNNSMNSNNNNNNNNVNNSTAAPTTKLSTTTNTNASPAILGMTTTTTITTINNNTSNDKNNTYQELANISDTGVAKAAIALPLEVPFTSETAIRATMESHDGPKGQTLDTICKAIMKIEGDRAFGSISK